MSIDPCVPPALHQVASIAPRPLHRFARRVGSRHFYRLHHADMLGSTTVEPAQECGKHFAEGEPGGLAARPTDGGPALGTSKSKAGLAKLAAGGAKSALGAAALTGALALPAGVGAIPFAGYFARAGAAGAAAPSTLATAAPATPTPPALSITGPTGSSPSGQAVIAVPEPSSVALLASAATLALMARWLLQVRRRRARC